MEGCKPITPTHECDKWIDVPWYENHPTVERRKLRWREVPECPRRTGAVLLDEDYVVARGENLVTFTFRVDTW